MMNDQLTELLLAIPLAPLSNNRRISVEEFIRQNGKVPNDYLTLLKNFHGGSGLVGDSYVDLWEPLNIYDLNQGYKVEEFAPGFTIFGSDGGDMAFAFDRNTGFIYHFAFIGMTIDEPATFISEYFLEFLKKIESDSIEY